MGNTKPAIPADTADIVLVITAHDSLTILVPAYETLQWVCYLLAHVFGIASDNIVFIDEEGNSSPPMNHRVSKLYYGLQYQEFPLGWEYRFEAVIDE
ncbi:hypothetical protein FN846DRAFT_903866 [Sphaerosporella brunnea]|uniref:Uncharacterized protein n=1 Tax=Sphaerosporella brunnea TaxID=1250544 RepID=A0A5J5F728_9PEZI|nr:hypothetical protein FN846DRAFT_903866 [Sphaerosporella brunnea]